MNNYDAIQALTHLTIGSEYYFQVSLDNTGKILSFHSGIDKASTFLVNKEKSFIFSDCFLASNWSEYESQRMKAWKASRQSFTVELDKIIDPEGGTVSTKWEFFFSSEDGDLCLGIGHPIASISTSAISLVDFFNSSLSDNKDLLENLFEDKLLGFWEFDLKNKTDVISQGLGRMLGYSQEELKEIDDIPWQQHIHSADLPSLSNDLKHHYQTTGNTPFKKEFRITTKDNQTIWVLGFGKTIEWSDSGLPIKTLGCLVDISERKKQEIWRREHHFFLKELAFEQSHSLRARVANILGILEILDSEPQNMESKNLVQMIKNEAHLLDQSLKESIRESVSKNQSFPDETSTTEK